MTVGEDEIKRRAGRFKSVLKASGIRMTPQRAVIFGEFARRDDHPDAESIFKRVRRRLPSISLDTVYRTLWLFEDLGLIATLEPLRGGARFDANMESHHHFVCSRCGATSDFTASSYENLPVPDAVRRFGRVERTLVELRGVCRNCLENPKRRRLGAHHHRKDRSR